MENNGLSDDLSDETGLGYALKGGLPRALIVLVVLAAGAWFVLDMFHYQLTLWLVQNHGAGAAKLLTLVMVLLLGVLCFASLILIAVLGARYMEFMQKLQGDKHRR